MDFMERLNEKRHQEELEEGKAIFLKTFREATGDEQKEMLDALEASDYERYMAAVRPVIIRQTMREFN